MQKIIEITDAVVRHPDHRLSAPVSLTIYRGEPIAICGPNGSGKTLLADIIAGSAPLSSGYRHTCFTSECANAIRTITFRNVYGDADPHYYQQRWNKGDEAVFPTVEEVLSRSAELSSPFAQKLISDLSLGAHLSAAVHTLSSGELRRFHLASVLLHRPELLIIDNPYIGLDAIARKQIDLLLEQISRHLTLIIIVSRPDDIPSFIHKVIPLKERQVLPATTPEAYHEALPAPRPLPPIVSAPTAATMTPAGASVVQLRHIQVSYDGRQILAPLSWTIHEGEHWALTGANGSGKTTLLSLLCADNPIAYSLDITLFGRRRGSGESIWDIKQQIGYVSPEIYGTYRKNLPAIDIVASGLHDTVGLYRRVTEEERARSLQWLEAFEATHLAHRPYLQLSSGEQRWILLVRAFVKSPALLVLDEPFHGLDDVRRALARRIIDAYLQGDARRTLIMVSHYAEDFPESIDHYKTL